MTERVLVVVAHPDDEVLGCGGAIAAHGARGASIHIACLADGVSSRGDRSTIALEGRRKAAQKACRLLGANSISFGDYADNALDTVPLLDLAKAVEGLIAEHNPNIIYTHHVGDVNVDHQQVHRAVVIACRPQPACRIDTLLFFEVASSTEWQPPGSSPAFAPNWFVDISPHLEAKLAAMAAYDMELREWPHPRSMKGISALAAWRGASIGVEAAEAFVLGRRLA